MAWHARGQGFKSPQFHHHNTTGQRHCAATPSPPPHHLLRQARPSGAAPGPRVLRGRRPNTRRRRPGREPASPASGAGRPLRWRSHRPPGHLLGPPGGPSAHRSPDPGCRRPPARSRRYAAGRAAHAGPNRPDPPGSSPAGRHVGSSRSTAASGHPAAPHGCRQGHRTPAHRAGSPPGGVEPPRPPGRPLAPAGYSCRSWAWPCSRNRTGQRHSEPRRPPAAPTPSPPAGRAGPAAPRFAGLSPPGRSGGPGRRAGRRPAGGQQAAELLGRVGPPP
jgi:hypothetical protein